MLPSSICRGRVFTFAEFFLDFFMSWIPFFFETKILFLVCISAVREEVGRQTTPAPGLSCVFGILALEPPGRQKSLTPTHVGCSCGWCIQTSQVIHSPARALRARVQKAWCSHLLDVHFNRLPRMLGEHASATLIFHQRRTAKIHLTSTFCRSRSQPHARRRKICLRKFRR